MTTVPIDPLSSPRYALEGKVVTMDADATVLDRGTVYVDGGQIAAVQPSDEPAPPGFEDSPLIRTGDTIYPGLIELHNHLSYNVLPLWLVPRPYTNRSQWGRHPDYRKLISGPMGVLGRTAGYVEAIVRYVECRCLMGGVTTSQGIALYSNSGIRRYYRGIVRNVEDTDQADLPEADTRIADVDARDAEKFLARLERSSCLLLHLSEGIDDRARQHFQALQMADGRWAITPALAGIHSAALRAEDLEILEAHGGAMIWSPLSNLLLYGDTADIEAAKTAGVLMGIGSDWSPSGSKNLLGELKVAHLVSQERGGLFTKHEILAMATINAAKILKWDQVVGSIEPGKRADLLVVNGRSGDPYQRLFDARETSVTLVVINGVPRYGQHRLMSPFGAGTEEWRVGRSRRVLNLSQETADPVVGALTLQEARQRLQDGMSRLAELALDLEQAGIQADIAAAGVGLGVTAGGESWVLELDHGGVEGVSQRPHLPFGADGEATGLFQPVAASVPLSELLEPVELDPLTVADDSDFLRHIAMQINLPDYVKSGLPRLYGEEPWLPDGASFVRDADAAVRTQLETTVDLPTFLETAGRLTLSERQLLVDQARILLEQTYVHLPLKRAMHAVDPVQRLKLLQYRLSQGEGQDLPSEIHFHNEMTDIFTSCRDLHTNYLLPSPFKERTAYLPFLIEQYHENGQPKYMVSKVIGGFAHESFRPGVEVLYWNGVPIRRAIQLNADRQAGSNVDARFARGLDALTIRPMVRTLPPDEEWVTITYRASNGQVLDLKQEWLIFTPRAADTVDPDAAALVATVLGLDLQTDAVNQAKKILYAPQAVARERALAAGDAEPEVLLGARETAMPTVFRAQEVQAEHGSFAYIRIFTFNVPDADAFVAEFVRLAQTLPQNGLIIDVRGNGGGLIYASERLLQVLTPGHIEPERAQFINTPLVLDLCRRHGPSPLDPTFDLSPWEPSIAQAVETGATYSRGYPITPEESCNTIGQKYYGPVLLITDALCYSATDIFAAGFQDHQIGPILGISGNTGAGGANVWTHRLLQLLTADPADPFNPDPDALFQPLPNGAGMRVSIRRTTRVGRRSGMPLEDLGVVPHFEHQMTRRDLLDNNQDLINTAGEILSRLPVRNLTVTIDSLSSALIRLTVTTTGIERLDVFVEDRPRRTLDVRNGSRRLIISRPADESFTLEIRGYADGEHAATSRHHIS